MSKYTLSFLLFFIFSIGSYSQSLPNVLVLFLDDLDPDFGCYGNTLVTTPNIDKLADQGILYTHAYAAGTVCSPSHTSLFTGCYTTTIGCPHHRSNYIKQLPKGYTILTEIMSSAGYFNVNFKSNGDRMYNKIYGATAKTDLNFDRGKPENNLESGKEVFEHLQIIDPTDISTYFKGGVWNNKANNQPFFAYANIETGKKHGFEPGRVWAKDRGIAIDSLDLEIPPHYADTPEVRYILASALDAVSHVDFEVGKFLDALDKDGLSDNTIVILLSDHGATLPRHKQNLWTTGIHIPLIIRWPSYVKSGIQNNELASIIDIAPTILNACQQKVPTNMEGVDLLSKKQSKRKHIFATRDGLDGYFDCSRAIITKEYEYIHHFFPEIPYRANSYAKRALTFKSMLALYKKDELNPLQSIYFNKEKEAIELYQLESDPHQINNLVSLPEYQKKVNSFQKTLFSWQKQTGDKVIDAHQILNLDKVPSGTKVDDVISQ
ncbi:sulfatase family protein [Labilibacter marinus]|uniref:sulfatase family protein n=1 Tax=Labilibacter marinus TaxID=1477105 RepID=UPI00094F5527|nr:sulfatase [Labilibacter marinus]